MQGEQRLAGRERESMVGKMNAGAEVQVAPLSLTSSGDRGYAERALKGRTGISKALCHSSAYSSSDRMGEESSKGNGMSTMDSSTLYDEDKLQDGLQGLSLKSGDERDSAPEGIAGETEQRSGVQLVDNGLLSSPPELSRQSDIAGLQAHSAEYSGNQEVLRGFDSSQNSHDYRPPPSLQLPDQTIMESEFAGMQQAADSEYIPPHHFGLPATLAVSPSCHDGKMLLDPNAREFTPSPTPCQSPVLQTSVLQMAMPTPYSIDPGHLYPATGVEGGRMVYGADYGGGSYIPMYNNGPSLTYTPVTASTWDTSGIPDMGQQAPQGSGVHASVQHIQSLQAHPLQPYGGMQPFMSVGLPTIGIPGGSFVPNPVTGREHVSRALLLNGVPPRLDDVQLKKEMEQWGPVRAMGFERRQEGLVTVHYYDLRHAKEALRDIQQQHLWKQQRMQQQFQLSQKQQRGGSNPRVHSDSVYHRQDSGKHSELVLESRDVASSSSTRGLVGGVVMWAQYTVPVGTAVGPDGQNQGTLVVFNLEVDMPLDQLKAAFEKYGDVKELRETPAKKQHKFVEFFDTRDAERALKSLDGTEIGGKRVKIEFSRPGGQAHKARVQAQQAQAQQLVDTMFPVTGTCSTGPAAVPGQSFYLGWNSDSGGISPQPVAAPPGGPPIVWAKFSSIGGAPPPISQLGMVQPPPHWNSGTSQLQPLQYTTMHGAPPSTGVVVLGVDTHSFERASGRGIGSNYNAGPASLSGDSLSSGQGFGRVSSNTVGQGRGDAMLSRRKRNGSANGNVGFGKPDMNQSGSGGKMGSRDSPRSGKPSVACKSSSREVVSQQYIFDENEVQDGETARTTLMIRNIPNKYSQQMLLHLLDRHCIHCNGHMEDPNEPESAYDFVYLPIDFKNRCNLGYAFVNFTSVQATKRLYKAFHRQQWEAFNSRKVCDVTYARVQGRNALEDHFKNSRFACDTDEYLPLIFCPARNGTNSSIPATVAAVHQSSRVLGSSSQEDHHSVRVPRNGEVRERGGDDYAKRALANGNNCTQDQETDLSGGPARGSSVSGHRCNMPEQHR